MANLQSTTTSKANSFGKGMMKDTTDIYMSDGLWYNAINAINNAHQGEVGAIGNEQSNRYCNDTPYTIIGYAYYMEKKWLLFSTDNTNSEIGVFDEADCTYNTIIKPSEGKCLNFKKTHMITAHIRENYDCTYSVYWQDGLNPDRTMNIENPPYKLKAKADPCDPDEFVTPKVLDCELLRLHPIVKQPCVKVSKAKGSGQLNNGSYIAVIAYSDNGIKLTDYCTPSQPQALWQDSGIGGGLEINLTNLDPNYEEYELVVIAVIAQQAIAKKIGYYSTEQTTVSLDMISASLDTVPLDNIPLKNVVYEKSDKMFTVNKYLIRTGVTSQPYINYQLQANKIKTEWVSVEYPRSYYWDGGNNVGYMRDEVYSFFIRWIYNTGNRTASYHIPGRPSTATDTAVVNTDDVVYSTSNKKWQVYDTSTLGGGGSGTTADGGVVKAKGAMSYWESTEKYPANKEIWGDLCNQPIRHHKMPSNEVNHIHDKTGEKIYVLGVQFSKIEYPKDSLGNPVPGIVGYEILRGSREGNRTIVSKGLFSNMLEFKINSKGASKRGLMANYPYNDLRADPFLSDDYTILDNNINDNDWESSSRLSTYKQDYLAFCSVETHFVRPALGGNHIKIYTEEIGTSKGNYYVPYKHPRFKFITDVALGLGIFVGAGMTVVDVLGRTTVQGGNEVEVSIPFVASATAVANASRQGGQGSIFSDLIGGGTLAALSAGGFVFGLGVLEGVVNLIAGISYYFPKSLDAVFNIIRNMSNFRDYALQYDSHGFFNDYDVVNNPAAPSGAKSFSRKVSTNMAKYVGMHVQDFDTTYRINNWNRGKYICVKLDKVLPNPKNVDDSKKRVRDVSGLGWKNPTAEFQSKIVQYYGAIKVDYENQYGQLDSIIQLPTDSCVIEFRNPAIQSATSVIFGGDTYINRYTEKNPYYFFNTWLMGEPDGYQFDYRLYVNGPAPRYYAAFFDFDASDFSINFSLSNGFSANTPSDYYRFDQESSSNSGVFVKKKAWFYLFYNGVRDYFTESEFNIAYRDYGVDDTQKFFDVYGNSFNDLMTMFRSDLITKPVFFKYDLSLSAPRLFTNFKSWGSILPRDYDPKVYTSCFEYFPNRVVYSLQQQSGMKRDNWKNFLPLNKRDFSGKINAIKPLNGTGAVMLYEKNEPTYFTGVDQLQTQNGVKLTIGDGGLFAGNYQSLTNADDTFAHGSSISSRAVLNTPYGMFYVSQQQGKIFKSNGQSIEEISRLGMKHWFAENLPSKMLLAYPSFPYYDNPIAGVCVQAVYDPTYELIYFTKKDYVPLRTDFKFDDPSGVPYIGGGTAPDVPLEEVEDHPYTGPVKCILSTSNVSVPQGTTVTLTWSTQDAIAVVFEPNILNNPTLLNGSIDVTPSQSTTYLMKVYDAVGNYKQCFVQVKVTTNTVKTFCDFSNPKYFKPCNWTLSFDPKSNMWVSFHSWEPTLLMPSSKHFFSILNNTIWKHNELKNSYCNYYGKDYPWEIEFPVVSPNQITVLKSFEYYLTVLKYVNDDKDAVHILDENFDRAVIYNSEQISGWLILKNKLKNDPLSVIAKPKITSQGIEIYCSKEENKYRFNQFYDITKDRGEFTIPTPEVSMWITDCSGYKKIMNSKYIDLYKKPTEHKKFRHYGNTVLFRKNFSNDKKMLLKLSNVKFNQSPR